MLRRRAGGSALLIVVVITFMVVALSAAYVSTSVTASRGVSAAEARFQARAVAWSGLNRAIVELDESCSAAAACSHSIGGVAPACFGNVDGQVDVPSVFDVVLNPKGVKNRSADADLLDLDHAMAVPDGWIDFRDQTLTRPGIAVARRLGSGVYSVRTRTEGALVTDSGLPYFYAAYRIRAYGSAFGETAGLEALLVRETQRPFRFAVFGNALVTGNGSIYTDSWNSEVSARYETSPTIGAKGDLGSNGTVDLSGGSGAVNGTIMENAGRSVPDADVPPPPPDAYNSIDIHTSRTLTDPRIVVGDIKLAGGNVLAFVPPPGGLQEVWVTSDADTTGSGVIAVDQPAPPAAPGTVRIYLTGPGPYKFAGNGIANPDPNSRPMNLQIISNVATTIVVGANFTGVIYAPRANVDLSGTVDLMGGVVAAQVTLNAGNFHFDESLPKMTFRTKPIYRIGALVDLPAR